MTFTLVSHLREQLSSLVRKRAEKIRKQEAEKERLALEVYSAWPPLLTPIQVLTPSQEEEARTRGTPVTVESFKAWKIKFDQELAIEKAREDEEKMKGLTAKEREEFKKIGTRLSGEPIVLIPMG